MISFYLLEKDELSTKWQTAAEIIGDKCEARVPDLIEGMSYVFRVKAGMVLSMDSQCIPLLQFNSSDKSLRR